MAGLVVRPVFFRDPSLWSWFPLPASLRLALRWVVNAATGRERSLRHPFRLGRDLDAAEYKGSPQMHQSAEIMMGVTETR